MTLDEVLTARAAERLSVTLFPVTKGFQANVSLDGKGWRVEMDADPVVALKKALGILPGASGQLWEPPAKGVFD